MLELWSAFLQVDTRRSGAGEDMKTTLKEFRAFKSEVIRLVRLLGLEGWDVVVELDETMGGGKDVEFAHVVTDFEAKSARVRLNRHKHYEAGMERLAKHEVTHILTAELRGLAEQRFVTEREISTADEAVANRLERIKF